MHSATSCNESITSKHNDVTVYLTPHLLRGVCLRNSEIFPILIRMYVRSCQEWNRNEGIRKVIIPRFQKQNSVRLRGKLFCKLLINFIAFIIKLSVYAYEIKYQLFSMNGLTLFICQTTSQCVNKLLENLFTKIKQNIYFQLGISESRLARTDPETPAPTVKNKILFPVLFVRSWFRIKC